MTITSRNTRKLAKPFRVLALVLGGSLYGSPGAAQQVADSDPPVDFAREVRPIVSQNCFTCHGPADDRRRRGSSRIGPNSAARSSLRGTLMRASYPRESPLKSSRTACPGTARLSPTTRSRRSEGGSIRERSGTVIGRSSRRCVLRCRRSRAGIGCATRSTTSFSRGSSRKA